MSVTGICIFEDGRDRGRLFGHEKVLLRKIGREDRVAQRGRHLDTSWDEYRGIAGCGVSAPLIFAQQVFQWDRLVRFAEAYLR